MTITSSMATATSKNTRNWLPLLVAVRCRLETNPIRTLQGQASGTLQPSRSAESSLEHSVNLASVIPTIDPIQSSRGIDCVTLQPSNPRDTCT